MGFLTKGTRELRDTVLYLKTVVGISRNARSFQDVDSQIEKLESHLANIKQTRDMAELNEEVGEYVIALDNMQTEVEQLLEEAKKKKKKGKPAYP